MSIINWPVSGGYIPTTTTTGTGIVVGAGGQYWPPSTTYLYPNTVDPLSNSAVPVGDHYMLLKGSFEIISDGKSYQLSDVLNLCKNVKYMKINNEIVVHKPVWDAMMTFLKDEKGYAGLTPNEFLDKLFAPK